MKLIETLWTRRTRLERFFISGTAVVLVVVSYELILAFIEDPDDRPPIIVNNGSITFTGQDQGKGAGKWKDDLTTPKVRLSHNGKAPTYLYVQEISGSTTAACQAAGVGFDGSLLTVTYTDGGPEKTLTIDVSGAFGRHLKLHLNGAAKVRTNDYTLTTGSDQVKVLKFVLTGGSADRECAFDGSAKFKVRQLN
jgi:hypothetical protein